MLHTFEISGLGKSPFRYIDPKKSDVLAAGQQCWCEHCGTMIKNRHFIKSSDGVVSIVGVDCLQKTGDQGLIDGEKRLKKAKNNKIREEKNMANQKVILDKQKAKNNGKTNWELITEIRAKNEILISEFIISVEDNPVMLSLDVPGFCHEMQHMAFLVKPYSHGQLSAIKKIHAKNISNARVNSKAYKEASNTAFPDVDALQSLIIAKQADIQTNLNKVRDLHLAS
jgi:hypothetical protein